MTGGGFKVSNLRDLSDIPVPVAGRTLKRKADGSGYEWANSSGGLFYIVTDNGVTGDGVTDDGPAINALKDLAGRGGLLYFVDPPSGSDNYKFKRTLLLNFDRMGYWGNNFELKAAAAFTQGTGPNAIEIEVPATPLQANAIQDLNCKGLRLNLNAVDINGIANPAMTVGVNTTIRALKFYNTTIYGIKAGADATTNRRYCINLGNCDNGTLFKDLIIKALKTHTTGFRLYSNNHNSGAQTDIQDFVIDADSGTAGADDIIGIHIEAVDNNIGRFAIQNGHIYGLQTGQAQPTNMIGILIESSASVAAFVGRALIKGVSLESIAGIGMKFDGKTNGNVKIIDVEDCWWDITGTLDANQRCALINDKAFGITFRGGGMHTNLPATAKGFEVVQTAGYVYFEGFKFIPVGSMAKSSMIFGSGNWYAHDCIGFNPLGVITTPFKAGGKIRAFDGTAAAPTASTDYTVDNADAIIDSQGGTAVSITIKDPAGTTIRAGLTTLTGYYLPFGFKINWGAFTGAPTVVVAMK